MHAPYKPLLLRLGSTWCLLVQWYGRAANQIFNQSNFWDSKFGGVPAAGEAPHSQQLRPAGFQQQCTKYTTRIFLYTSILSPVSISHWLKCSPRRLASRWSLSPLFSSDCKSRLMSAATTHEVKHRHGRPHWTSNEDIDEDVKRHRALVGLPLDNPENLEHARCHAWFA